jgi:O-antigen/teichoic acid export membrane protein
VALAGGTAMAQLIIIAAMPVITRLYTPSEIGVVALFTAFSGFWSTLLTWRYEMALLNAKDDSESYLISRICMLIVVVMSVLSVPVLYGLIRAHALGFGLLPYWCPTVGVPIFLGLGTFMVYRLWGLRSGLVKPISKATITQSASNVLFQIVFGFAGFGIPGLFGARFMGVWSGFGALHRAVRDHYRESRSSMSWPALKTVLLRYVKFPKYEIPSVVLDQLALTIPVPMIASLYGVQAAGWFGLARTLVAIPNTQVGSAVADVFHLEFARRIREGEFTAARRLFYKLLVRLSVFGLLPLAGAVILGPWLVPWVFGKPWAEMGIIAACIAPWLYAALVVSSLSRLLSVLEHQEYKLIYDTAALTLMLIVYVLAKKSPFSLVHTVLLLTAANVISYGIYILVLLYAISRSRKMRV